MKITNKYISLLTIIFSFLLFTPCLLVLSSTKAISQEAYRLKKVVIDAGHGGKDFGAMGRKSKEKDIVLSVALKVGKYIQDNLPDVEVIYTRDRDVFVPLGDRGKIANESGADLFISIHCNSNPNRSPYGSETYVMGLHKTQGNLDVAMRENAVITYEEDYSTKYEGYDPNSPESYIIFSLIQNSHLEQSLNMASLIQDEFRERARRRDRGVKQAGFVVLWQNSMPSVLVELGFLSNSKEETYLLSDEGQAYLASAIYRAFRDYKVMVESRSSSSAESQFNASLESSSTDETTKVTTQWANPSASTQQASPNIVLYRVQITASSNPLPSNNPLYDKFKDVEQYHTNGLYKYVVGKSDSYAESVGFCDEVRKHFPDAFVVAFKGGNQISIEEARKISGK